MYLGNDLVDLKTEMLVAFEGAVVSISTLSLTFGRGDVGAAEGALFLVFHVAPRFVATITGFDGVGHATFALIE